MKLPWLVTRSVITACDYTASRPEQSWLSDRELARLPCASSSKSPGLGSPALGWHHGGRLLSPSRV